MTPDDGSSAVRDTRSQRGRRRKIGYRSSCSRTAPQKAASALPKPLRSDARWFDGGAHQAHADHGLDLPAVQLPVPQLMRGGSTRGGTGLQHGDHVPPTAESLAVGSHPVEVGVEVRAHCVPIVPLDRLHDTLNDIIHLASITGPVGVRLSRSTNAPTLLRRWRLWRLRLTVDRSLRPSSFRRRKVQSTAGSTSKITDIADGRPPSLLSVAHGNRPLRSLLQS
jgi:hypothetical protein